MFQDIFSIAVGIYDKMSAAELFAIAGVLVLLATSCYASLQYSCEAGYFDSVEEKLGHRDFNENDIEVPDDVYKLPWPILVLFWAFVSSPVWSNLGMYYYAHDHMTVDTFKTQLAGIPEFKGSGDCSKNTLKVKGTYAFKPEKNATPVNVPVSYEGLPGLCGKGLYPNDMAERLAYNAEREYDKSH